MRIVALFAAGLVLGGPALAQPAAPQSVCYGNAEGARGERVSVVIQLTQQGETVSTTASWDPPLAAGSTKASPEDPYPGLTLQYPAPRAAGLGEGDSALVLVMAFAPPGSRSHGNPARQLDGLVLTASSDGGAVQTLRAINRSAISAVGAHSATAAPMCTSQWSRCSGPTVNGMCRMRNRGCPRSSS